MFLGVPLARAEPLPTALRVLPGHSPSSPAGQAVGEVGDDISGTGLSAALIAGWRDAIALPALRCGAGSLTQMVSEWHHQSPATPREKEWQGCPNVSPRLSPPACAPAPAQHHPQVVPALAGAPAVTWPKRWKQNPLR